MNACQKCVFAVRDDNPHCGLRGFRSDFNVEYCSAENDTIPNGYELQEDGYFSWVEKKKEYPKTYEECCRVLGIEGGRLMFNTKEITEYEENLICKIGKLEHIIVCRDAYWKIAGEEMGLDGPWEPDWKNEEGWIHCITNDCGEICCTGFRGGNKILAFPTAEMRDAFYENFDPDIEFCKELL